METKSPSIFEYADPCDFLRDLLQRKQRANPRFSMRAWAKQLGMPNHVHLSLILNGKRKLLPSIGQTISDGLKLAAPERKYFDLLVLRQNAATPAQREIYDDALNAIHPAIHASLLEAEVVRCLTDWAHIAVLEMVKLADFADDPAWIARRLGDEITPAQALSIRERLLKAGLLARDVEGRLQIPTVQRETPNDVPSDRIRRVQAEFIARAATALEEQAITEREFQSWTFSVRKRDLPALKEKIREFCRGLAEGFDSSTGDEVYHLGTQLFRLTRERGDQHDH